MHKKGIQFGDYALCVRGRKPILGKSQLVLGFSRKEARDNVFDQITRVLDSCEVEYVKWDCNRSRPKEKGEYRAYRWYLEKV